MPKNNSSAIVAQPIVVGTSPENKIEADRCKLPARLFNLRLASSYKVIEARGAVLQVSTTNFFVVFALI